jgi:lipid-binding SYLF domain-containing protein
MSVKNLGIFALAGFLVFATASVAPAQADKPGADSDCSQSRQKSADMSLGRDDVMQIQRALRDWEYNPGAVNGMMSPETKQAIREFQLLNGLPATGVPDEATRSSLLQSGSQEISQTHKQSSTPYGRTKPSGQSSDLYALNQSTQDRRVDEHHATKDNTNNSDKNLAKADTDKDVDRDAAERAQKAAAVLEELVGTADKNIPNELLSRAEAVAVIPHVIKGALGLGGRYGKGLVSHRLDNGRWSAPAFIQIGGGSFGAQIGVSATDLVLVFTDAKALDLLTGGKDLKLGVDAGVVAGPIGRSAEAGVNAKLDTAIYAYSRSKGLFAGIALDGAVLDIDNSENKEVYGNVSAKQILSSATVNSTTRPFMDALAKFMPKKKI